MPMKISGVKTIKRELPPITVRFIEMGGDEVLFSLEKNLIEGGVDVINCQIENVNGMAKITIPIIAEASVE